MGCEAVGRWAVSSASTSRAAPPAHAPRSQPAMALRASQGSLWPEERHRLPSMSPATVVRQSRCRSSAPSGVKGSSPDDSGASETGETLNCQPGLATLGFVGMGIMGVPMVLTPLLATSDRPRTCPVASLKATGAFVQLLACGLAQNSSLGAEAA